MQSTRRREERLNFLRISLVQRYIIKELAQSFVLCFVSLLTLILIGRGLQMRNLFLGLDLSALDAALLFIYMVPMFMLIVVPFSCMLSVFLSFLRMSTDRELVALKAGGVSLYQLLPAPVIFCLLAAAMNLFVSLFGVSWGMNNFRNTVLDIANNRARIVVQPGVFNKDIFGLTLFARKVDPDTQEMTSVIFEDRTQDKNNRITILASSGNITTEPSTGSILFTLRDGHIYRADGQQFGVLGFDLPGHGASKAVPPVKDMASLAKALLAGVEAGTGGKPFFYAGVSVSGCIGLQLLLDAPERIRGAAIINSAAKIGEHAGWMERAAYVRDAGTKAMRDSSAERWFAPGFLDRDPARAEALLDSLVATDAEGYAGVCEALAAFDARDRLGAITRPVIAIGGADDVATPPTLQEALARGIPGARVEIVSGAGHLSPGERPQDVADILAGFFIA